MSAGRVNFLIEKGASWHSEITWSAPSVGDPTITVPVDITGWQARFQIRAWAGDPTIILSLTSTLGGGIVLGGALGTITLDATDEQTSALLGGRAVHALEMESPAGDVTRLLEGRVTMSPEVVRDEGLLP